MRGKNTKKYWNNHWSDKRAVIHDDFQELIEGIEFKGKVLDIGAGISEDLTVIMKKYKAEYHALDISEECVKKLVKIGVKAVVFDVKADNPLPYPDDYFDIVMSKSLLEHISEKDCIYLSKEVKRILKPNGLYIVHCSDENWQDVAHVWHGNVGITTEEFKKIHRNFKEINYIKNNKIHLAIYEAVK